MTRVLKILAWTGGILALAAAPGLAQTAPPAAQPPAQTAQAAPASGGGGSGSSDGTSATPAACLPWNLSPIGTRPSLSHCPPGRLSQFEPAPSPLAPSPNAASGSFGSGWLAPR